MQLDADKIELRLCDVYFFGVSGIDGAKGETGQEFLVVRRQ